MWVSAWEWELCIGVVVEGNNMGFGNNDDEGVGSNGAG